MFNHFASRLPARPKLYPRKFKQDASLMDPVDRLERTLLGVALLSIPLKDRSKIGRRQGAAYPIRGQLVPFGRSSHRVAVSLSQAHSVTLDDQVSSVQQLCCDKKSVEILNSNISILVNSISSSAAYEKSATCARDDGVAESHHFLT